LGPWVVMELCQKKNFNNIGKEANLDERKHKHFRILYIPLSDLWYRKILPIFY